LLDAAGDTEAMVGLVVEDFQDEQVESALQQIGPAGGRHDTPIECQ
jgi:hypothetical protein